MLEQIHVITLKRMAVQSDDDLLYVVVDEIDELVNTRVQGQTYIIESTRPLITLKSGQSYLCIKYTGETS